MNERSKQGADHSRRGRSLALLVAAILIVLAGAIAGAVIVPKLPPRDPSEGHGGRRGAAVTPAQAPPFIRGVCWEAAGRIDSTYLEPLVRIRADWVSQTPFGWQRQLDSPEIRGSDGVSRRWGGFCGESDDRIVATARWAHTRGIHVLLKRHIWTRGGWSGSIAMKRDEDWGRWFAVYREVIVHYADLAQYRGI